VPLVGLIVLFVVVLCATSPAGRPSAATSTRSAATPRRAARGHQRQADPDPLLHRSPARWPAWAASSSPRACNSVDLTVGGGTLLLDSISAAVIGGVSLFGGRGRVSGALFGGLIIGMISNGTDLVGSADWVKYVTTGAILLAAVTLDTVARRRQAAAGR
jgi:hypothetical protein